MSGRSGRSSCEEPLGALLGAAAAVGVVSTGAAVLVGAAASVRVVSTVWRATRAARREEGGVASRRAAPGGSTGPSCRVGKARWGLWDERSSSVVLTHVPHLAAARAAAAVGLIKMAVGEEQLQGVTGVQLALAGTVGL